MKNDELLISQLINETCKEEETSSAPVHDLSSYFEIKVNQVEYLSLKKYLSHQALKSMSISFNSDTQCFRVELGGSILDFPSNWSVFEKLMKNNVTFVSKESDEDFLCDIFSEIEQNCESFVLINENNEYNLITFSDQNGKSHVKWFQEYFERKAEKEILKAA